ncbi:hypothetical protein RFI_39553 [Reticulomyxa filosa]|uniref:Uncharacterized protein n=1 Tax=Reticulomyxa filosa TaxID=46433 RepID=X6LB76_RETFI|nr:hypothetical protein RFI_39553 [Reticulomyxa filosa]|eukprot:ETN97969.1 hypothetical protein RFI_39553 [Reticulomyxa filosa]
MVMVVNNKQKKIVNYKMWIHENIFCWINTILILDTFSIKKNIISLVENVFIQLRVEAQQIIEESAKTNVIDWKTKAKLQSTDKVANAWELFISKKDSHFKSLSEQCITTKDLINGLASSEALAHPSLKEKGSELLRHINDIKTDMATQMKHLETRIQQFNGFTTAGGGNKEDKRTPEMFSAEGTHWLDSRLEQFAIPRMVIALIPSCAKFLHEIWLEEGQIGGWQYALHYCFHRKEDHWLTPWQRLSPSAKYLFTQQVVITIKAIILQEKKQVQKIMQRFLFIICFFVCFVQCKKKLVSEQFQSYILFVFFKVINTS